MLLAIAGFVATAGAVDGFHLNCFISARAQQGRQLSVANSDSSEFIKPSGSTQSGTATRGKRSMALGKHDEIFNWTKQWYPVVVEEDTDAGKPHEIQLLGKRLVLWKGSTGEWACFKDRCPHRAAPLSEGRVEKDGTLRCTYHGWRYDVAGTCVQIPQSDRGGKDEAHPAACASVYPTQVRQGMVWVWAESGPDAVLESSLTPPNIVSEMDDEEGIKAGLVVPLTLAHRDIGYSWETLGENIMDPSHLSVAHHGIVGDRVKDAVPLPKTLEKPHVTKEGIRFGHATTLGLGTTTFTAPTLVEIDTHISGGVMINMKLWGTPTRPGWVRLFGRQVLIAGNDGKLAGAFSPSGILKYLLPRLTTMVPRWVGHLYGSFFFHQDVALLHGQERAFAAEGHDSVSYPEAVYTPTSADRAPLAMRRWIAKYGGGGPTYDSECQLTLPPRLEHKDLFDVYNQHTKDCTTCLAALKRINQLLGAAKVSFVLSLCWTMLRASRAVATSAPTSPVLNPVSVRAMLPGIGMGMASLGAVKGLQFIQGLFYTYSFNHQDNE